MRRDSAWVKPGLHTCHHELSPGGSPLPFLAERGGGLGTDPRVRQVTINFTEILPAARSQDFLAASERHAGEKKKISADNRQCRARAKSCKKRRTACRPVEKHQKAGSRHQHRKK